MSVTFTTRYKFCETCPSPLPSDFKHQSSLECQLLVAVVEPFDPENVLFDGVATAAVDAVVVVVEVTRLPRENAWTRRSYSSRRRVAVNLVKRQTAVATANTRL